MSKLRVHELAKELNKSSKEIIEALKGFGIEKTALSTLDVSDIDKVKKIYKPKTENKVNTSNNFNKNNENKKVFNKKPMNNDNQNNTGNKVNNKFKKPFNKSFNSDKRNERVERNERNLRSERNEKFAHNRDQQKQDNVENKNNRFNTRSKDRNFNNNGNKDKGFAFKRSNGQNEQKNYGNKKVSDNRGKSFSKDSVEATSITPKSNNRKQDPKKQVKKNDYKKSKKAENKIGLEKLQKNITKKAAKKKQTVTQIEVPETILLQDLANLMKIQPAQIIKKLFMDGKVFTLNDTIDFETAEEIALEYDIVCEKEITEDVIEELLKEKEELEENLETVPPVVCVMGHVDHGKTSLLDAIRNTNAVAKESGGITQHIGASQIVHGDKVITFLDTPGHEAFTAMRLRGAQSTNIAILVVAADDGVMPQTIEAINHAKAAGVEIIVAINKIDKPAANIERVKNDLTEHGIIVSDWGGDIDYVPVSAHTGEGIEDLLDMVLLTAEVLDLKANPNRNARGLVLEAKMDPKKGKVASLLVQKGTLKVGDPIAVGSSYGKVRAMINHRGEKIETAGPSTPVEIIGLSEVPKAGETFVVTDSDKDARTFAETYQEEERKKMLEATKGRMSLDDLFEQIKEGNLKELNIVIKADVQGSVEAMKQSLIKLSNEEVMVKVIHGGVGNVTESDAILASASNAIIIGFNVKIDTVASDIIARDKVDCRLYSVIYDAIEDVEDAMKGMLEPVFEEQVIGKLLVRQTFKASGVGVIAGCFVESGYISKKAKVRLSRGNKVLYDGEINSLKRFKDEVKEVKMGFECGIVLENYSDIQVDDTLEAYIMVEVER